MFKPLVLSNTLDEVLNGDNLQAKQIKFHIVENYTANYERIKRLLYHREEAVLNGYQVCNHK